MLKRLANRARISRTVSPHVLRHTFAVTAIQKGISLPALQRLLGHDTLQTTRDLPQPLARACGRRVPAEVVTSVVSCVCYSPRIISRDREATINPHITRCASCGKRHTGHLRSGASQKTIVCSCGSLVPFAKGVTARQTPSPRTAVSSPGRSGTASAATASSTMIACPQCGRRHAFEDEHWFDEIKCSCGYTFEALEAGRGQSVTCPHCKASFTWNDSIDRTGDLLIGKAGYAMEEVNYHVRTVHCPQCDSMALYGPPDDDAPVWIWGPGFKAANPNSILPPGGAFTLGKPGSKLTPREWRVQISAIDERFRGTVVRRRRSRSDSSFESLA